MSREYIQAVVDSASNRDTIFFHAGTYDWSDAPLTFYWQTIGAINIVDKSLTIRGERGTVFVGAPSVDNPPSPSKGIQAFFIKDLDCNNDVSIDGLEFRNFYTAINAWHNLNFADPMLPYECPPNLRDLTIKNCKFLDIHHYAISVGRLAGNLEIRKNEIASATIGIEIDWLITRNSSSKQTEGTRVIIADNRIKGDVALLAYQTRNALIQGNSFYSSGSAIVVLGTQVMAISDNYIEDCGIGIELWGGIELGIEYITKGVVVKNNRLKGITQYGITLGGDRCYKNIITKNMIKMKSGSECAIYTVTHDNFYKQNEITGSGWFAFILCTWGGLSAHNETLLLNTVDHFGVELDGAHYILSPGTHDNIIVGTGSKHISCIDGGTNNLIMGIPDIERSVGFDLNMVTKQKNEEPKAARNPIK
jgi:hypothetical protein